MYRKTEDVQETRRHRGDREDVKMEVANGVTLLYTSQEHQGLLRATRKKEKAKKDPSLETSDRRKADLLTL